MEKVCKPVKLHFKHYIPNKCDQTLSPIIFVHGLGDTGKTWSKVMERIAKETQRQAYVIDLRNHGESGWNDVFTFDSVHNDIEHFLAQNGITKCVFVTHSYGSRVCMYIALKKPELVEKIVAEEGRLDNVNAEEFEQLSKLVGSFRWINLLPKTMNEKEVRNLLAKRVMQLIPDQADVEDTVQHLPIYKDSDDSYCADFNIDAMERGIKDKSLISLDLTTCGKYTGPALFLAGGKSLMASDKDEKVPEYFPNAEFYRFENAGHTLHLSNKSVNEYISKVCDYIND